MDLMESVPRSSGDEAEFGRAQGYSQRAELNVKVDGRGNEQNMLRSKHSAMEQRRRCKINDRFQMLTDLIPHTDQKRDKASLLLEVIEYIKFLQEKVQKYESYPAWNPDNEKLLWSNNQGAAMISNLNLVEASMSVGTATALSPMEPNYHGSVGRGSGFNQSHDRLITDPDNLAANTQSEWSSGAADCTANGGMMNEPEELTVDDGTISFSNIYSQGLLATLAQAVESSGIDLSQASIFVHINFGRRAIRRRSSSTALVTAKDHDDLMGGTRVGCNGVETDPKRQRLDI